MEESEGSGVTTHKHSTPRAVFPNCLDVLCTQIKTDQVKCQQRPSTVSKETNTVLMYIFFQKPELFVSKARRITKILTSQRPKGWVNLNATFDSTPPHSMFAKPLL
jgi:hypothetical protein